MPELTAKTTVILEERYHGLSEFLAHRASVRFRNEEIPVTELGFELYTPRGFSYPEQRDDWWEQFPDVLVRVADYRVKTPQRMVYSSTVEHYLATPLQASELGKTLRQDIAPRVLVSEETRTLYLAEGNHRCAAAMISGREILMRLAPLTQASKDF